MKRFGLRFVILAVLLALFAGGFTGFGLAAVAQPNMVNARNYLQQALDSLNAATTNKGGYRAQAIKYVNLAITAVNNGISHANSQ
jgi:hypothetical protein